VIVGAGLASLLLLRSNARSEREEEQSAPVLTPFGARE